MATVSIIEPPVRNGGIASSSSRRPYSTPIPLGPEHLVPGERREVDVQRVEVDRLVRHRLAGVQHGERTHRLGAGRPIRPPARGAGHIRMVAECNDFDTLVELQRVQVDAAVVGYAVPAQRGAGAPGQLLPRDQIGVVFEFGGDDDVAGTDGALRSGRPQHIRDQVERLGGVLGEHQLVGVGADERRDVGAALLVGVGGLFHQLVRAAVHPAVGGDQKLALGVQHLQRASATSHRNPGTPTGFRRA